MRMAPPAPWLPQEIHGKRSSLSRVLHRQPR
jgi:hypothetical protein